MTVEREQVKTAPPPEKSAITTLSDGIKRQVPFAIEHSISADQISVEYLSLQDLLQGTDESERRELQPLVDGMILAWHERREKDVISKFKLLLSDKTDGLSKISC